MPGIKRSVIGLARLSQRGSIQNARLGCEIISRRRNMTEQYSDITSAIVGIAPNNRDALLVIDSIAD